MTKKARFWRTVGVIALGLSLSGGPLAGTQQARVIELTADSDSR